MGKGYLLILIGAVLSATLLLPLPAGISDIWGRLTFMGYLIVVIGLREVNGSAKELQSARFFLLVAMLIRIATPWVPQLLGNSVHVRVLLEVLQVFFTLGVFFWLLKSEYMWSPNGFKRMDLLLYSGISVVYLLTYGLFWMRVTGVIALGLDHVTLLRMVQFFNIFYYVVLWFTLAKLYVEARKEI